MALPKLPTEVVNAAILGFEEQKRRIDAQIAELRAMLIGAPAEVPEPHTAKKRGRRRMSAAGRKAIAEAQRKRWAAKKAEASPARAAKPKRKLSAEGKAAIVAAVKKRWAAKKAAVAHPAKRAAAKQEL